MDKVFCFFCWRREQIGDSILYMFRKVDKKGRKSYTFLTGACLQPPPAHRLIPPFMVAKCSSTHEPFRLLCFGLLFKTSTEQIQT